MRTTGDLTSMSVVSMCDLLRLILLLKRTNELTDNHVNVRSNDVTVDGLTNRIDPP